MARRELLAISFYSIRELDKSLRTKLDLPGNPYSDEQAQRYLHSLGIIHWRDDKNPRAVVIQPSDDDPTEITDRRGFNAFRSIVNIDPNTFKVVEWEQATPKYIQKHGDSHMWLHFNLPVVIISLNHSEVHLG